MKNKNKIIFTLIAIFIIFISIIFTINRISLTKIKGNFEVDTSYDFDFSWD